MLLEGEKNTQAFKKNNKSLHESGAQVFFSLKFKIFLYINQACRFIFDPGNSFWGRLGDQQHGSYFEGKPQGQNIACNKYINKITIAFR